MQVVSPSSAARERTMNVNDLIIINHFDKPCTRLIAQVEKIEDGKVTARYITTGTTSERCFGPVEEATPIADFGVVIQTEGRAVCGLGIGKSRATYPDGKPRVWQPEQQELWPLRKGIKL